MTDAKHTARHGLDLHSGGLRHLSLFTGAGGGEYAACLLGWRTVCYVERDSYCQRVIRARINDRTFHDAPIWGDVRTFDGRPWRGLVDVIGAGFPCQPFSVAGAGLAEDDERNAWPDTIRIIREVRPRFAFLENVPNLRSKSHGYFGTVLGDLAEAGFHARWCVLGADDLGAPHTRKRLWLLATDADNVGREEHSRESANAAQHPGAVGPGLDGQAPDPERGRRKAGDASVADSDRGGRHAGQYQLRARESGSAESRAGTPWGAGHPEPVLRGMAYGVANRSDRLTALGNGQVPCVAATAFHLLSKGAPTE